MLELDFTTKDWIDIPKNSKKIRISLLAAPPVQANAALVFFTRPIIDASGLPKWIKLERGVVDNIPNTSESHFLTIDVKPGNYYSFKQLGEAHLLMPGYDELKVGMEIDKDGHTFFTYGGKKTVKAQDAILKGTTFLRYEA